MNEDTLMVKRWFKFQQAHRTIPPPVNFYKDQHQSESIPFRVLIKQVDNIQKVQDKRQQIKFIMHLYAPSETQGEFFGRTYESMPTDMFFQGDTRAVMFEPVFAYFHLRLEQQQVVHVVIEVMTFVNTVELNEEGVFDKRAMLGWCSMGINSSKETMKVNLRKGSSRFLISKSVLQPEPSAFYMYVDIVPWKYFEPVKFLVPEGCIVGQGDELLGLQEVVIPIKDNGLSVMQDMTVFIQGISVMIPLSVESEFKESVRKFRDTKYKDKEEQKVDIEVQIVSRRLVVAFHNGWTFTNTRGLMNQVILDDGKIIQQYVEGQAVDYRKTAFNGAIDITHVYKYDRPSPQQITGQLIFQLEFDLTFVVKNLGKQRTTVCAGWCPIPIQTHQTSFEEDLIVGPGKSLTGRSLVDLSECNGPIVVSGQISGEQKLQISQAPVLQQAESKYFKKEEVKSEQEAEQRRLERQLQEDSERLQQLERTLKQLQQERVANNSQTAEEYEKQLEELQKREQKYQDLLKEMQEKHSTELQRTMQQYEELKKMMVDLTSTQQQYLGRSMVNTNSSMAVLAEGQLFDQADLEKWRIIESMTSVPRKTFYKSSPNAFVVEAQFGGKQVGRGEMAFFSQNGIRGLLQNEAVDETLNNPDLEMKSLELEQQDLKTASLVLIQFLSFRPKQSLVNQYINENYQPQSIYSEEASIPSRLVMTINFFDFPVFTTEPIIYENGADKRQFQEALRNDHPLLLIREAFVKSGKEYKEPVFRFEVEPSQSHYPHLYRWFCWYLYNKCITIDIWDCDSLMLFGTVKIPLRQLLRQQKPSAQLLRTVDIISPTFKKIMGTLTIMIKNVGKTPQVADFSSPGQSDIHMKSIKKKVISKQPLDAKTVLLSDMPQTQASNADDSGQYHHQIDPNERIRERIRRHKLNRFSNNIVNEQVEQKQKQLNEINKFKEYKKISFVKGVIQEHISDERVVHALYGRSEIIPFEFRNTYKQGQTFSIVVYDPDFEYTQIQEAFLVYQPAEWKYYVDMDNLAAPKEYQMISVKNAPHNFTFYLKPGENVTFLLKVIFFRDIDSSLQGIQKSEEIVMTRGRDYLKRFCFARSISVFINHNETGHQEGGVKLRLYPHANVVDHIYRFNERDNSRVTLTFPALYAYTQPKAEQRPLLFCTDGLVAADWADDYQIRINLRVPEVRKQLDFNIVAYTDPYFREQIANWQIQVNSLSGFGVEVPLGQVQGSRLTVPCDVARQVKFFASHPLTVWFPPPFDKNFTFTPGHINIININIRQFSEQIQRVQINCVDVLSKELVYSWIAQIKPSVPPISQVFDVKCPFDQPKHFIFPYYNKLNSEITLIFVSSHPDLLQLVETKYVFKAQERLDIRVRIQRKGDFQKAEIKVFVGDEEKTKESYDCILFRVQFVQMF